MCRAGKPTGTGFLPPPYQPDVGFSPVRLEASAYPQPHSPPRARRRAPRPALVSPAVGALAAAFAVTAGPDHEARSRTGTAPRRVIAASGTTPSLSCKRRPRSPRGPLLRRGYVVLAVIARTASAASLEPSRRLPVLRLYAGSLPYGRVLAGLQTFPTLRHRSFPWCHRLYAEEPCGCICPIPSPQTLAFALF